MRRHSQLGAVLVPAVVLFALGGLLAPAGAGQALAQGLEPALALEVGDRFPVLGDDLVFTLTGPAGASFKLQSAPRPGEVELEAWGRVFLELGSLREIAAGTLDAAGAATVVFPTPDDPVFAGRLMYFQAAGRSGTDQGVSGAIVVRLGAEAPSGARQPEAIAVTPDGSRAYVVHQEDATVSVIDTVTDTVLADIPLATPAGTIGLPVRAAVDPEGRHLFVVDPRLRQLPVLDVATDSVVQQIPVPPACRGLAFDFAGETPRIYVTNERDHSVLVIAESPRGTFRHVDTLDLAGRGPGPIGVRPDGELVIGHRLTHELELVDPSVAGGLTLATIPLGELPLDLHVDGGEALVPVFRVPQARDVGDGDNVVLRVDLDNRQVIDEDLLINLGTDYFDLVPAGARIAVVAAGSGAALIVDGTSLELEERIDLAPGGATTHPRAAAFVPAVGGGSDRLYVVNHFRETVRPIDLSSGPPFTLLPELPLAWSGAPRVPLVDLEPLEDGEWFYSTVEFFNGTAENPNPVTCNTCHPHFFATGLQHPDVPSARQAQAIFDVGSTGPWMAKGSIDTLEKKTDTLFGAHGRIIGTELDPVARQAMIDFQAAGIGVPESPHLEADGSLSDAAERGRLLFDGEAQCATCHVPPLFIPEDLGARTIELGVGTGIAPANVPSLRGVWSSAPYLWDGRAPTLLEVLEDNPDDQHGVTSTLTPEELQDLVAYLESL